MHVGGKPREAEIKRGIEAITTSIIGKIKMRSRASIGNGSRTIKSWQITIAIPIEPESFRDILRTVLSGFH